MNNLQYIKVPFITAINLYPYTEAANLSIVLSGNYVAVPFYAYVFTGTQYQFVNYVSGSGNTSPYFAGSGYTFGIINVFYDNFDNYTTGYVTGQRFLDSGISWSGYITNITFPKYTDKIFSLDSFFLTTFSSMITGSGFSGFFISGSRSTSGYNQYNYNQIGLGNTTQF